MYENNENEIIKELLNLHTISIQHITKLSNDTSSILSSIKTMSDKISDIENSQKIIKRDISNIIMQQQKLQSDVKSLISDFRQKFDTTLQFLSPTDFTKEMLERFDNSNILNIIETQDKIFNTTIDLMKHIDTSFTELNLKVKALSWVLATLVTSYTVYEIIIKILN